MQVKFIRTLAVALAGAGCALGAQAALVKLNFSGANSSPNVTNTVFGQALATVSGYAIYESDTPATLFSSFNGITNNYHGALRAFAFDVRNAAGESLFSGLKSLASGFGYVQVRDGSQGQDRFSLNNISMLANEVVGEPAFFSNVQFTLGLGSTGAGAISSPALVDDFDPGVFNGQRNLSLFVARQNGAPAGQTVSFNFNFSAVSAQQLAVPEPGSLALFGVAALALAGTRRRKV